MDTSEQWAECYQSIVLAAQQQLLIVVISLIELAFFINACSNIAHVYSASTRSSTNTVVISAHIHVSSDALCWTN